MPDLGATPRPIPGSDDALTSAFYAHCAHGELRFQRCAGCGRWRHLPRILCANCASPEWSWERSSGRGRIFSWTIAHQPMHPAFAADVPYPLVIVEMEEGVRLVSGLRGPRALELDLDLPVEVEFERVSDQIALPFFHQAASDPSAPD
jgi:hypothetical protein